MSANAILQISLYLAVLLVLVKPLGAYMARIYEGRQAGLNRIGAPFEDLLYRLCGVDPAKDMRWTEYALAMLLFNLLGVAAVYGLQRLQAYLPLNPQAFGAVSPDSSFNTATSFATNTNWQGYVGETTMSYLTQMLGLTVQNFFSAATGMAIGGGAHPGVRPALRGGHRQFLGGHDPEHALYLITAFTAPRGGPRQPGRDPELRCVQDRAALGADEL